MNVDVVAGFVATGVALVVFMVWSYLEIRRVDRVSREQGTADDDSSDSG